MFLAAGVGLLFCSDSMFILGCTLIAFAVILFLAMKSSYIIAGFAQINDFDQYEYKPITEMLPLNAGQVKALVV